MRYFLSLFLLPWTLLANVATTENEPSSLVDGLVSAITGQLYLHETDIIAVGKEPIHLTRNSLETTNADQGFFTYLRAYIFCRPMHLPHILIGEPNGSFLPYMLDIASVPEKYRTALGSLFKKPYEGPYRFICPGNVQPGFTNTARGEISARTNLQNQFVISDKNGLTCHCPDSTKRYFIHSPKQPKKSTPDTPAVFLLQKEELLNGNQIIYIWDKNGDLKTIKTLSPSGKLYAEMNFSLRKKEKNRFFSDLETKHYGFDIKTRDFKFADYSTAKVKEKWMLSKVARCGFPTVDFCYYDPEEKSGSPKLKKIVLPNGRILEFSYTDHGRIKEVFAPTGKNASLVKVRKFVYDLPNNTTTVFDAYDIPTKYHWDENLRLIHIKKYNKQETLINSAEFEWDNRGNLLAKTKRDHSGKLIIRIKYEYDSLGNVLKKSIIGDLTGNNSSDESYSTYFTYSKDDKNLPIQIEEDNGLKTVYTYLSDTNLPAKISVFDHENLIYKKTYSYDEDNILRSVTKEDANFIKKRKKITPITSGPYTGMPQKIEKVFYKNGCEIPLLSYEISYTDGGKISSKKVFDNKGNLQYELSYTHDLHGHLLTETDPLGNIAHYQYDDNGNQIFARDFANFTETEVVYDYSNRPINVKTKGYDGLKKQISYQYDLRSRKTEFTDQYGHQTFYNYDDLDNLIQEKPSEKALFFTYDDIGNQITKTDAKNYTTFITYNAYGKPTTITYPDQTREIFTYLKDGSLASHTDQNGFKTTYTHDALGRMLSETKEGLTSSYIYKGLTLVRKVDPAGYVTTYQYDGTGRKSSKNRNGNIKEYFYDRMGRRYQTKQSELISLWSYDLLNRVIEKKQTDLSGKVLYEISYTYDAAGNRTSICKYIASELSERHFTYDSFNRLTKEIDPMGHETKTIYDDSLHQTTLIDPLGTKTIETFDEHYRLSSKRKYTQDNTLLYEEQNCYDNNDNLIRKTLPGSEIAWKYDEMNRLSFLNESSDKITHYTYTPTGKVAEIQKPSSNSIYYTYDAHGNLLSKSSSDGKIHYEYKYDPLGYVTKAKDLIKGMVIQRSYDADGNLLSERFPRGQLMQSIYNNLGQRTKLTLPDESHITYDYDPLYLRKVSRYSSNGKLLYTHTYDTYDTSGNLLKESSPLAKTFYHYDKNGRPIDITSDLFNHTITKYDAIGNVCEDTINNYHHAYHYDAHYNLIGDPEHRYSYDVRRNRIQKDSEKYTFNSLNQNIFLSYDPDGNLTYDGINHYSYDALGRLIHLKTPTNEYTYTYDAFDRLLMENQKHFLYDDTLEIGFITINGISELRILGETPHAEIGATVSIELDGAIYHVFNDLYGNIASIVSHSRHKETCYYTPFGETNDHFKSPWGFASKRKSPSGLIYFGKRFYNPTDGRWLTPDPLGLKASPNLYTFVSNSPLTHYDHYGLEEVAKNNFADLKYYAQCAYNTSLDYTFRSPRFTGTLEAFGGLAEMSMGASLFAATSAASAPLSFVLLAHGFDHFTTGLKSAMTGRQQTSLTSQTLQSVGFSENVANFVDNSVFVLAPTAALWTQRAAYTVPCFANSFSRYPAPTSHLSHFLPNRNLTITQERHFFASSTKAYDQNLTQLAHSFSKHAGRHPETWGRLQGPMNTWHDQAFNHLKYIYNTPGKFKKITDPKTKLTWIEKRLPDGRGIRLNQDYTFKGFVD